jgi:hypothetical protein
VTKLLKILLLIPLLTSCFREDEPVMKNRSESIEVEYSIYTHQSFFDLESRKIVSVNPVDSWDLGFESSDTGRHIIVNSGRYLGVYSVEGADIEGVASVPAGATWKFDKSDGDPDSTAVGEWFNDNTGKSKSIVYIIGINDGINYSPYKKIVIDSLSEKVYSFRYANPDGSDPQTFEIAKDPSSNYVFFSFSEGGKQVLAEPVKTEWDLEFTQYSTILYTDDGIATPYSVRGVLINRNGVEVALDSLTGYTNISINDIQRQQFSKYSDAIGHDWKSVDLEGAGAEYAIRQNNTYIIRNNSGSYFKLRFTGYYNDQGAPGYPRFEIMALY